MRGMDRLWKPNVTVAALMERDGRFLLVEEETDEGRGYSCLKPVERKGT